MTNSCMGSDYELAKYCPHLRSGIDFFLFLYLMKRLQ